MFSVNRSIRAAALSEPRISGSSTTPLVIWVAAALYVLSTQKYLVRDALSTSTGPQGLIEAGLIGTAFLLALGGAIRDGWVRPVTVPLILLALFGLLALASSAYSFWPPLSIVKALLYLAVLALAHLANGLCGPWKMLRCLYWCYISTVLVGLAVGLCAGSHYPLLSTDDYSGRTRLGLFATFPGTEGELAAIMFLVGRGLPKPPHWYWQGLLLGVNIAAAGKTSTVALAGVLALEFLLKRRRRNSWLRLSNVSAAVACLLLICFIAAFSGHSSSPSEGVSGKAAVALESIYGNQVAVEARSLDGRSDVWQAAVSILPKCLWLGFGFDGARDFLLRAIPWSGSSHNGILELMLTAGIPGAICFLTAWMICARASFRSSVPVPSRFASLHVFLGIISMTGIIVVFPSYLFGFLLVSCYEALIYNALPASGEAIPALTAPCSESTTGRLRACPERSLVGGGIKSV